MDTSLFPSKATKHFLHPNAHHHPRHNKVLVVLDMQSNAAASRSPPSDPTAAEPSAAASAAAGCDGGKWAERLLKECAAAISDKDSAKIHHLLWMLNELASPYGDCDQKLAAHFLQALFCKATETGPKCYKTLVSVSQKSHSFDSARKLILKFQEVSPWTTFGHVASNGAILEALDGEPKLHIIDISNTFCTQWPTLLEALATRHDDTPHLKLTVVVTAVNSFMKEIAQRMEKFARLMGVPFEFNVVSGLNNLGEITKEILNVQDDESVAINCIGALRRLAVEDRPTILRIFRDLRPKVVTVVEEHADFTNNRHDFVKSFEECLRFYTLYFSMLEECFPPTSNEKLMLERESSRSILRVLGCNDNDGDDDGDDSESREEGSQWSERLREAGFSPFNLNDDAVDDVKALLKRYKGGWTLEVPPQQPQQQPEQPGEDNNSTPGIYLRWNDETVVWASAWKP